MQVMVLWLLLGGGSLLLELGNPGFFFFLSLVFGSAAAIVALLLGLDIAGQMVAFGIVSLIAFIVLKRWVKAVKAHKPNYRTNVDALVGRRGAVTEAIRYPEAGAVKVHGETWSARSVYAEPLERGVSVEIVAVVGCHVMVKRSEG